MNRKVVSISLAVLLIGLVALPGCVPKADLDECKALMAEQTAQIQSQNATIEEQAAQIEEQAVQIEELKNGETEVPKDPTHNELIEFMREDRTNEERYLLHGIYAHDIYAHVFLRRAKEIGIRGYLVIIWIEDGQRWFFTGFETTDKGWVYILRADREVRLEVGKKYHELNNFSSSGVDDTIRKICIFN